VIIPREKDWKDDIKNYDTKNELEKMDNHLSRLKRKDLKFNSVDREALQELHSEEAWRKKKAKLAAEAQEREERLIREKLEKEGAFGEFSDLNAS
jgi:hypothetical protein